MPVQTREYTAVKKLKPSRDVFGIRMAQISAINYLEGNMTAEQLKSSFANLTSIASLAYTIFGKSNPTGIALGLIAFLASAPSKSHKQQMIDAIRWGNEAIQNLEKGLYDRSQYDATVDVELAFLEAKDYHTYEHYFTGVTGVGAISAYYDGNGNKIPNP